ncbi:MAG TPA: S8 family serine peptidase [Bacteroidia bacterium]|nr:S8 family serine peptidase [Bacteroidia bacterium]
MNKGIVSLLTILIGASALFGQAGLPLYTSNELIIQTGKQIQASPLYIPNPGNTGNTAASGVWETLQSKGAQSMSPLVDATIFPSLKDVYQVILNPGVNPDEVIKAVKNHPNVVYVNRVAVVRLQGVQKEPIELDNNKQWYFRTINMTSSWWDISYDENKYVKIAVIDNAIRTSHEDLRGRVASNVGEIQDNNLDDDGNGYVDDYIGWDIADNDNNPMPPAIPAGLESQLYFCHGTHVAGIIAAESNNSGIASLGINNKIIPIKVVNNSAERDLEISLTNIIKAFNYAVKRKADIINCSFGTAVNDPIFADMVKQVVDMGVIVVAAAGNYSESTALYPAAYDGVIAVGATDRNDGRWKSQWAGSNYGNYIDVMAPGQDILSTLAFNDYSYGTMSGTSMAAPIVASFAGLLLTEFGDDIRFNMERIIKNGCDNIDAQNPGFAGKLGSGRINIDKTFNYALTNSVRDNYEDNFIIYPNPASSQVNIPFQTLSADGQPLQLQVYSSTGASVQQETLYSGDVAVSGLPQGIYYMVVSTAEGKSFRSRLLINR